MSLALRQPQADRRIRVMLVDDSAIVRGFMRRWVEEDPRIELVRLCADGAQAVADVAAARPDVIVLDIDMPGMDGVATLPFLRHAAPEARIIMASSLTPACAERAKQALALGATDVIAKPQAAIAGSVESYHRELIEKIVAIAEAGQAAPVKPLNELSQLALRLMNGDAA